MMRQLVYSMIREKFHAPLLEVKGACTTSIARLYRTRELIKCVVHFAVDPLSLSLSERAEVLATAQALILSRSTR